METALALIGVGSFLIFVIILIIAIFGLLLRKSWGKKGLTWSILPLLVFFICVGIQIISNSNSPETDGSIKDSKTKVIIDFDDFKYKVEKFKYNRENNSVDIELSTNIPSGTKVNVGLTKMLVGEEGIDIDLNDPVLKSLNLEREEKMVEDGKLNLHYDSSDTTTTFINGQYGVWLDFEVGSLINEDLYDEMGTMDEAKQRFINTTISGNAEEGEYTVILGQQYFEITNSVSYNDLKKQEQEKIQQKKASAKEIRFAELDKNPDKYYGEFVKYQGEILQIIEDETSTVIRLAVTKDSYGYDFNDVVYITYKGTTPFVKEDIVTVYGTIQGSYTYESQAGHQITLPYLEAEIIE
ncbi:hypothetical protein [Paenibacillus sp. GCM10028914]|uniref:hypothetical protein n=1 Tax=Paenibacillus sp. GCM10028914 TaxID=3273416 RepID=UPI00360651F4